MQKSDFCCGGGKDGWIANVDFFLRPNSVTNLLEGKYDNRQKRAPPSMAVKRERLERRDALEERKRRGEIDQDEYLLVLAEINGDVPT
jgi:hypothetical protein